MPSRQISDLTLSVQKKFELFKAKMDALGIPFIVTCTKRALEEQKKLYAQGRTAPGPVVTWTLNSRHIPRDEDEGTPDEGKSHAFDIAIMKSGKAVWDIKVDVNEDDKPDYRQAGEIGESVGLTWGGRWKKPDMPHFEG